MDSSTALSGNLHLEHLPVNAREMAAPKQSRTQSASLLLRFFPSLTDIAFLFPIAALFIALGGYRTLLADCDTGWHIRTGDWILLHGRVPHTDLFSFTMPNAPWFAWEWGWDVLASMIHTHWALAGIVLVNLVILGAVGALLYRLVRTHAPNDLSALLLSAIALCGSSLHWLARPHLLSWLFLLAFLHLIERAEQGRTKALWWCPILTLLWVNLHGSFFIGISLLVAYGAGNIVRAILPDSDLIKLSDARNYLLCAAVCLGASLVNPYGWRLHEHVFQYLSDAKQLDMISEYASTSFHSPLALCFEIFLALGFCAALQNVARMRFAPAIVVLLWAHLALKSARNIPIFLFIASPVIAGFLKEGLRRAQNNASALWIRRVISAFQRFGSDFQYMERVERLPLIPIAAALVLASGLGLFSRNPHITDFDPRDFPVGAAAAIAHYPAARVFTFDQWGDYLIYKTFPKSRVFVDGRSDLYGSEFTSYWTDAISARYTWKKELSRFSINTVLLRTTDALASVLKLSSEWKPVFDDGVAIVFRSVKPERQEPLTDDVSNRVFPVLSGRGKDL